jgi:glycosyltransferase involved in cell wall biosynthesis
MPIAIENFNFDKYDIVISSSYCVAKGIITSPDTLHISYIHTPMRYAWDMYEEYFGKGSGIGWLRRILILPQVSALRMWDQSSSSRQDYLIANSKLVKERISKYWRKESEIINPPVDVTRFRIGERKKEYFLMVSSFEPNRRVDLAVRAFTELGFPLKIVGSSGRLLKKIEKIAGLNIEFLGRVSDDEIIKLFSDAKALIMTGKDDFGIAPLEAIASGTPVIAYANGGSLDTVIPINPENEDCIRYGAKNGVFFYNQDVNSVKKAVRKFLEYDMNNGWDRIGMRKWAKRFTTSGYKSKIKAFISDKWEKSLLTQD